MKDHANPVTEADIVKFAGFIARWQTELNLGDWRLIYSNKSAKDPYKFANSIGRLF